MTRSGKGALNLVLSLFLAALPVVGFLQRQSIFDWYKLRGYNPPVAIANLASSDTMTDKSRHIFYVNQPQLVQDTSTFRQDCFVTEQTIILGCYHSNQQGIFVYDVKDSRLNGIQEVTSAHEMLHAAYDRLSSNDRRAINKMLTDYYQNDLHDQRIIDTMNAYKKFEPNDVVNEMHSVFGTEIAGLPAPLESYYKQYFQNRAAVVADAHKYENEFTSRNARATQIETQIKSLKAKIDTEEANLRAQLSKINADRSQLDNLRNANQIDTYNSQVAAYNSEVDDYNNGVTQYKRDIDTYNSLVEQYNAVAGELKQLYGAIDTRLSTQPSR